MERKERGVQGLTQVTTDLSEIVGNEHVQRDPMIISHYAADGAMPGAVVFPRDPQQVSQVVTYASQKGLALLPWGSGSKMGAGNPPKRIDLVVCTSRLDQLLDVDTANLTLTAQAGVTFHTVQSVLASQENRCYLPLEAPNAKPSTLICSDREHSGCFLPMDPPFCDTATLGGIMAANSSGPRRLLYGLPRDLLLGVRFVAPDGAIIGAGGKTVKNVSGYDISKLMIGSHGTLGILCEMTLRLLPLPERMKTLLLSFASLSQAVAFSNRVFGTPLLPAAVEILNTVSLRHLKTDAVADPPPRGYAVAVAMEGFEEALDRMDAELTQMAGDISALHRADLPEDRHLDFWRAVSNLSLTLAARFTDLAVVRLSFPISRLEEMLASIDRALETRAITHGIMAHAGSGVCLVYLPMDSDEPGSITEAAQAVHELSGQCRQAGGWLVVQSAPKALKADLPIWDDKGADLQIFQRIKDQVDPEGIMSPGRFIGGI
jgi:FAD/FMN-containing dehydrogenase